MTTTRKPLSKAQLTTLTTIAANGGEMNSYAGQRGFYCNSVAVLVRLGLLDSIGTCRCWGRAGECDREHGTVNTTGCYGRVRITEAGRAAI